MNEEVEKIQKYVIRKGIDTIDATEDKIIEAAIRIATRWGGEWAFVCELRKEEKWNEPT